MLYIKVEIKINENGAEWARKNNQPVMIYPVNYDKLIFLNAGYIEENGITYVLGNLDEAQHNKEFLDEILKSPEITIITREEAIKFSEKNEKRLEKITDEGKIRRLEIKSRLKQKFTKEEEEALNPKSNVPGLEYTKILADKF